MSTAAEVTALVTRPREEMQPLAAVAMTIEDMIQQKKLIAHVVKELMKEGVHYGVIPGTEKKDKDGNDISKRSLLKPGADLLCSLFRLDADYETEECVRTPSLIYYRMKCVLKHAPTGIRVGAGMGSCNSNEDKYLRPADKLCPKCGKAAIKKSKYPPRDKPNAEPGWYCYGKIGGCGANFEATDQGIIEQDNGIKDPADLDNTILKMACKRSRTDAVLTVTAAGDFFSQDLDDLIEKAAELAEYISPPPKDDLKEKLEASIAEQAPEAAKVQEDKKFGKRFAKKAATVETTPAPSAADSTETIAPPASAPPTGNRATEAPRAAGDTGEAATAAQKDAITSHIRKKGWKLNFVRIWFAEHFGFPVSTANPIESLTQMQADAAHFLVMAHGTSNYRKIRMEYAEQGMCRRDENDVQW